MRFSAQSKVIACLPASDFPSENPRIQTRNYYYTTTLCSSEQREKYNASITKIKRNILPLLNYKKEKNLFAELEKAAEYLKFWISKKSIGIEILCGIRKKIELTQIPKKVKQIFMKKSKPLHNIV